jgi:hypothetical protein
MKTISGLLLFLLVCIGATSCIAGDSLSIRLVEASEQASTNKADAALADIVSIMQKSPVFRFASYRLAGSSSMRLPARKYSRVLDGFKIRCDGKQDDLSITVYRNKKQLLKTTVSLKDNKPLMFGGLPGKTGKMILVFLTKKK